MKKLLFASTVLAACGNVIDTSVDAADEDALPFTVGPLTPVISDDALLSQTFANHSEISRALRTMGDSPTYEIAEMRVATDGTPHTLTIELVPPTGGFARTLVTTPGVSAETESSFACSTNGVPTGNALCTTTPLEPVSASLAGPLSQGRYSIVATDELSGITLDCERIQPLALRCEMPPQSRSYRVTITGDGFGDLWDWSTEVFTDFDNVFEYTGGPILNLFYTLCSRREEQQSSVICTQTQNHAVLRAIDSARVEFASFELRLTTGSNTASVIGPPIVWDLGNDDLPGDAY